MRTLIRGGQIYDGGGGPPYKADVLIENEMIVDIAPCLPENNANVIEAEGYAVTPGFVDIHRHCDIAPFTTPAFGQIELAQGITSTAVGNCGLAPVPSAAKWQQDVAALINPVVGEMPSDVSFKDYPAYVQALQKSDLPINMSFLAGAGAIKTAIRGFDKSACSASELANAAALVQQAMSAGALGLSLGIMYQPECYSTIKEMVAFAKPAATAGGVLSTHIRGEGDSLVSSVNEVIEVAKQAGLPVNISHLKATGIRNWHGKIFEAIEAIEKARAEGLAVTADFYPYTGGSTTLQSLLPPSILENTTAELLKKLAGDAGKKALREEISRTHAGWDNMATSIGWDRIMLSSLSLPQHAEYSGKTIAEVAKQQGYNNPADLVCELMVSEEGRVGIVVLSMSQKDVDDIARLPYTALISDALYGGGKNPHPRLYGAFPRFIREYVFQRGVVSLPVAIQKMTSMPAARIGIKKRGYIKKGYFADVIVFKPEDMADHASYKDPCQLSTGIYKVFLAGKEVFCKDKMSQNKNGRFISRI